MVMMMMSSEEYSYDLPFDILIEIFKRLPVKSLIKFTSVSKQWKSVIRSSPFISDHNNIQQQQLSSSNLCFIGSHCRKYAIIKNNDKTGFQRRLTLPHSDDNFRSFISPKLIGYSQGLFGFHNNNEDRLVIWNPSIRKPVIIPLPNHMRDQRFVYFCFTVVRNATEPTIFCISDKTPSRMQIYTLTTRAWRTVANTPPREPQRYTRVVTDRFIYWITRCNHWILSFDITSEQFTELCLPPTLAARTILPLSKLRESLVVLETDRNKQEVGVWMMKMEAGGVENSFTKQFTINVPADTPNLLTYWDKQAAVHGFTIDGQVILQMKVDPGKRQLLYYDPDSKSFKYIGITRKKKFAHLAGPYMETLLLLDY